MGRNDNLAIFTVLEEKAEQFSLKCWVERKLRFIYGD